MKSLSRVRLFVTPWTVAHQAPPSMDFSRQEYWGGLSFASPGDLPNPGIEPRSPTLPADALPSEPLESLTSACFTSTLLTWLTFLHACPKPQPLTVLIKGPGRGRSLYWFPWWITAHLTSVPLQLVGELPSGSEDCPHILPATYCTHPGCHSRTLLQSCKLTHQLNHWYLCCWPWALSSILKLGKHSPYRHVGYSPKL